MGGKDTFYPAVKKQWFYPGVTYKPARANSTKVLGSVAENSRVCRVVGKVWRISPNCAANPISNKRSASSNTIYRTELKSRSISTLRWRNRPGVAIMISTQSVSRDNFQRHDPDVND